MYKLNERIDIEVNRQESNFDRACDAAYRSALSRFVCDENGHLLNVEDSHRSTDSVVIEFIGYRLYGSMGGQSHMYSFSAWVERNGE